MDFSVKYAQKVKELKDMLDNVGSDGCTFVPEMGQTDCCLQHDMDYRKASGFSKQEADTRLRECIASKGKWYHKPLSWVFYIGVKIGGWKAYNKK